MQQCSFVLSGLLALAFIAPAQTAAAEDSTPEQLAAFENTIRPLFVKRCIECHGPKKAEAGLRFESRAALLKGGDSGPAVSITKPQQSLIIKALRHVDGLEMPPDGKLPDHEIAAVERWIRGGAAWPDGVKLGGSGPSLRSGAITPEDREFWSFRPVADPQPPQITDTSIRNDIDRFVLQKLHNQKLTPMPAAGRREWIRRATFDLTGLPPTPTEIEAFLNDRSAEAFERVVNRLLDSKAYGERWGRHWLDVVRYADTAGETADYPTPLSYKYRNWVINAINADMPYDQFVRQQIAGDILANQLIDQAATKGGQSVDESVLRQYREMLTATGFIAISRRFGFDVENYHHLTIQDTIDVIGQSMLGLTLGCARCHDHKYDPVNMTDYYAWYGIFESTRYSFPGSEEKKRPYDLFPVMPKAVAEREQARHAAVLAKIDADIKSWEAKKRSLAGSWRSYIDERRLKSAAKDRDGHVGFHSWYTDSKPYQVPLVAVNTSKETLTVPGTVPPGKLVAHPQQREGVGIAWRSPAAGRIRISGSVRDAHDCGDSVTWFVDHLHGSGLNGIANGGIERNGSEVIKAIDLDVKAGDFIQLAIMPKTNHGCDLTQVELTIDELEGKRRWNLVDDVIGDFLKSNPLPDRNANPAVWYFYQVDQDRGEPFVPSSPAELAKTTAAELERKLAQIEQRLNELRSQRESVKNSAPNEFVYAAIEKDDPKNARIQLRGETTRPGDEAPRRNLEILGGDTLPPAAVSGRLQLSDWLTRDDNPLFARVMINRIWQHHFGRGLVSTENDFGHRGERPSHPELLDWLASRFKQSGYSMKAMHRLIMSSAAYQRSSRFDANSAERDPAARLFWRFNRRRLDAEEIRDAMLLVSEQLDRSMGTAHPFPPVEQWGFSQHAPFYAVYPTNRRSVYLMQQRLKRHPFLGLFDGADTNVSTARREPTTVPTQALFLMNNQFVHEQAAAFVNRIMEASDAEADRIPLAFNIALGRPPTADDIQQAATFLATYRAAANEANVPDSAGQRAAWEAFARSLLTRNEFLYVD